MARNLIPTTERMAGSDAAWLHMDRPRNLMIVNTLLTFDQRPEWDAVEGALRDRVVKRHRRFRQKAVEPVVTFGALGPRWEDHEPFDVSSHVTRVRLDGSHEGDPLELYVGEQAALPLDRDRPLWQAHFIDRDGDRGALLLRTHHAIADGVALMHLLDELTDPVDAPADPPPARPPRPTIQPVLRAGSMLTKLGGRLLPETRMDREELCGTKLVRHSIDVPISDLKTAGRRANSTINDVTLAAVARAIRRYRQARHEPLENLDIVVPFNLRRSGPEAAAELGNKFGLVFVTLPVAEADADERAAAITAQMERIKASHEPEITFGALATMGRMPPSAERAWVDAFVGDAGAVITNIAGPRHAVSLTGTPVTGLLLWVPSTGPIGLGVSLVTYNGTAVVGLIADTSVVPDVDELTKALNAELSSLAAR